jgi:hypothetical protein
MKEENKNLLKYAGVAAASGGLGYYIAKCKNAGKKISFTLLGIAALLYTPRGCDTIDKYLDNKNAIEQTELNQKSNQYNIDATMRSEELRMKQEFEITETKEQYTNLHKEYTTKYQDLSTKVNELYNQNESLKKQLQPNHKQNNPKVNSYDYKNQQKSYTPKSEKKEKWRINKLGDNGKYESEKGTYMYYDKIEKKYYYYDESTKEYYYDDKYKGFYGEVDN